MDSLGRFKHNVIKKESGETRSAHWEKEVFMSHSVLVIGAGAAGLLAAFSAARAGAEVTLLEKKSQPGLKLLVSGAGRCNLTNSAPLDHFISAYFGQGRFLYPAFQCFFQQDLLAWLARYGVYTRTESSGKIFPLSNRAVDVRDALWSACRDAGVIFSFNQPVLDLLTKPLEKAQIRHNQGKKTGQPAHLHRIQGVRTAKGSTFQADAVVLACGGSSWPGTGSSGDGYRLAGSVGHQLTPLRPGLVALACRESWVHELSGISCPVVKATLLKNSKVQGKADGGLLWTHSGVSGPVVLRLSRCYRPDTQKSVQPDSWQLMLNLLPELSVTETLGHLKDACRQQPRSQLNNALASLILNRQESPLARNMITTLLRQAGGEKAPEMQAAQASTELLKQYALMLHQLPLTISGTRGYREAIVTAGGIRLSEVDPKTMMSRLVLGLYAAGEVLDIDGDTGGFNLQAAFSTGFLAGAKAAS